MSLEINEAGHENVQIGFIDKEILFNLGISDKVENILDVFDRVADLFWKIELNHSNDIDSSNLRKFLLKMLQEKKLIPSTTILMNAGRIHDSPLSACTVPHVDLKKDFSKLKEVVDQYHLNGMGTGFNFDDIDDPIPIIQYLNHIGVEGQKNKNQLRPVGNMGVLSINHPKLLDFINIKNQSLSESWVFNFSVLVDSESIDRINRGECLITKNGEKISSQQILDEIAKSVYTSGEPGLIFIDRLNSSNQVPSIGEYKSLAPCGEIGLVEGETCQFSYLNLGNFIKNENIDYTELERCIRITVRLLDNAVEYNISRFELELNKEIAKNKRRIGIGVCGFADLLSKMNIKYDSNEARKIAEDIFSFVNYISKKESIKLAEERGTFGAFSESKYLGSDSIILNFSEHETETVSKNMWLILDQEIRREGLRNCSTIAIPPTGRSSYIIEASPSIEPYFHEMLKISPQDQLGMISSIQKFTDDSISKTVNVSENVAVNDIKDILLGAMNSNLKGITIYRDKSRSSQPQKI